jgi:hypothetical protein
MPWELSGNGGTNPPGSFPGTTDDRPVVIKTNNTEAVRVNSGAGTSKVEISAQDRLAIAGFEPFITPRDANAGNARSCMQGVNGDIAMIPNSFISHGAALTIKTGTGNVGIGTSTPNARLHVVGDVFVTGDFRLANADCAEHFDIAHAGLVEPGTVMILGECVKVRTPTTEGSPGSFQAPAISSPGSCWTSKRARTGSRLRC